MQLRRVLYFSLLSRNLSEDDLMKLLEHSRVRNKEHDVTGLMVYAGNYIIQHIEGLPSTIEQLITNIRSDDRVNDFTILVDETKTERLFPDWHMGFHTPSTDEINQQNGYVKISRPDDLDSLILNEVMIKQIMKKFYTMNNGAPIFR